MRRVAIVAVLGLAASVAGAADAHRAAWPVHVTVRGRGEIHLRIASGVVAPCGSSSNVVLFDDRAPAGAAFTVVAEGSVCVEHTYGAFRDGQWSTPVIVGPRRLAPRRWEPFVRVDVSTDAPFTP